MATKKTANVRKPAAPSKAIVPLSDREAPAERDVSVEKFVEPVLNQAQMNLVLNRTPEHAIKVRQGRGGNYRYVPHGYVTDTLNKLFGFDWDFVQVPGANGEMFNLREEDVPIYGKPDPKTKLPVVIGSDHMRHVTVFGYIEARTHGKREHILRKSGAGSQLWLPGAELGDAIKGAISDCLKVCAQRFGIALDLYYSEDDAIAKLQAKNAARERNEQVEKLLHQPPNTFVVLLSRAKSEFDVDLPEIEEVAEAKAAQLMNMTAGEVAALWKKIQDAHPQTIEGEVKE